MRISCLMCVAVAAAIAAGCGIQKSATPEPILASGESQGVSPVVDEVAAERAKLSVADRQLVEAQEWCAVSTDERLGSMGSPLKLDIKGQPVFVCCKGCKRKAEANPDKTLKTVAGLKAKAATPAQ
jgi:hypothetical protein